LAARHFSHRQQTIVVKKALIIGATSGIAQAIAAELAASGSALFLAGRSATKLELVARDLETRFGVKAEIAAIDFDDFSAHAPLIDLAIQRLGGLDVAFVCHGNLPGQQACERDYAVAEASFRTNFLSPISFLGTLADRFEKMRSGCIVAISSVAGDRGRGSNYFYGAAKAALSAYLSGLRNRLYASGVRVVTVKPGFVDTPMTAHLKTGLLTASPAAVARDIVRAARQGNGELYTPWFWRWIMLIIRLIPEPIFVRLKL
jgi:decaprenylphospho-beta-D-erythro-pentofuranosid-2-ulose 2-reductase